MCLFKIILGIKLTSRKYEVLLNLLAALAGAIFKTPSFILNYENFYGVSSEFRGFCFVAYAYDLFRQNFVSNVWERSQLTIWSWIQQIQGNVLKWHLPHKIAMCFSQKPTDLRAGSCSTHSLCEGSRLHSCWLLKIKRHVCFWTLSEFWRYLE